MTASYRLRLFVSVGALLVLAAACSGEATPDTTVADTTSTSLTPLGGGEEVNGLPDGSALCARFDPADLERILGPLIEPPRIDPMAPTCAILASGGVVFVRDISEPGLDEDAVAATFAEDLEPARAVAESVEPVDGLGDEAYLIQLPTEPPFVMIRTGTEVLNIAVEGDYDGDQLVEVARLL